MKKIEELLKTAKAATAGPWGMRVTGGTGYQTSQGPEHEDEDRIHKSFKDAKHIAQFSPATIIPILEELAAARAFIDSNYSHAKQTPNRKIYREARAKTDEATK
jgi:hypothetical protein